MDCRPDRRTRWISDYFGVDWHLLAKRRRASSIKGVEESVDQLIQERGWKFTRAALIREYAYYEYLFEQDDVTLEEVEEAQRTFFEIFNVGELVKYNISMNKILFGIEDADNLKTAAMKARKRGLQKMDSKKKSRN